jgi:Fe(3+) dicitrate transport protein
MPNAHFARPKCRTLASVGAFLVCLAIVPAVSAQDTNSQRIVVTGETLPSPTPNRDDARPKLEHIMKEVSGTEITVTKKATVIKLDKQPPVEKNNLQELFSKAPGLLLSEQQNPGQFNYSYRGLGNPQEFEYTLFLQDGLPLMSEWIGFPTLYYQPFPQSVSEIQLIRGGSSLLYVRLIGGISNLADEKYYSRAFLTGLIDPAPGRSAYAGLSVEF